MNLPDFLEADAEESLLHLATVDQLGHDVFDHRHRNREADPGELTLTKTAPPTSCNGRIHADDVSMDVRQRTAGIAGIDRGIDLDEVLVIDVGQACRSPEARDDSTGHREPEVEWRAESEHEIALGNSGTASSVSRMKIVIIDSNHGNVSPEIDANQLGLPDPASFQAGARLFERLYGERFLDQVVFVGLRHRTVLLLT